MSVERSDNINTLLTILQSLDLYLIFEIHVALEYNRLAIPFITELI